MNKIDVHIDFNTQNNYKIGTLTNVDGEIYFIKSLIYIYKLIRIFVKKYI
jgi:hypothetical protein